MTRKKHLTLLLLIGPLGYFLGSIIYNLIFSHNFPKSFIAGTLVGILGAILYYIYLKNNHPEIINDMWIEQYDERETAIRARAGHMTLYLIFIITFIATMVSFIMGNTLVGLIVASTYLMVLLVYLTLIYILKKKM